MALTTSVNIRLSPEQQFLYQNEAAHYGLSLSTYLRQKLEERDLVRAQLYQIHDAIVAQNSSPNVPASLPQSIDLEILLLLRALSNPGTVKMIHSELKRLGYQPWSPSTQQREDHHDRK